MDFIRKPEVEQKVNLHKLNVRGIPKVVKVDIDYIVEHKISTNKLRKWLEANVNGLVEDEKKLMLG